MEKFFFVGEDAGEVSDEGAGKKRVCVRAPEGATGELPVVYLNVYQGDGAEAWARLAELGCGPLALVTVGGIDWERDMTPWPAEPATRNEPAYTGGAGDYLQKLTGSIVPAAEAELAQADIAPAWRGIAGYSLAGLFALWSLWQTDVFLRAASASGSLWYEGWLEYAAGHELARVPERVSLSLGSKEHKTPNRLMREVRRATEATTALLSERGAQATFELNPGNHFTQTDLRMARAIAALM